VTIWSGLTSLRRLLQAFKTLKRQGVVLGDCQLEHPLRHLTRARLIGFERRNLPVIEQCHRCRAADQGCYSYFGAYLGYRLQRHIKVRVRALREVVPRDLFFKGTARTSAQEHNIPWVQLLRLPKSGDREQAPSPRDQPREDAPSWSTSVSSSRSKPPPLSFVRRRP
jgi:hypothetical protein